MITIGDYVTRKSYDNDIVFEVIDIDKNSVLLKGIDIRLLADSPVSDLVLVNEKRNDNFCPDVLDNLDRNDFFYMPGKVLHIDSDKDYLDRCLDYYKKNNVLSYGKILKEKDMPKEIVKYLKEYNPDILVLTGHDAYNKRNNNYKNSNYFINAVIESRKYEKNKDKLIIIAGACQSDYEGLLKSGATFASSPKRINIHALDPAIIATYISLYDKNKEVDLKSLLSKTRYGKDGIGGLKSNGTMYTGYPRSESNR